MALDDADNRFLYAESVVHWRSMARHAIYLRYMAGKATKRATAKVFTTGRSQAVRIPKEYRFPCDEVLIEREGERVILTPRPKSWRDYFARASRFTDDYPDSIEDRPPRERERF